MIACRCRRLSVLLAVLLPWLGGCSFGPLAVRINTVRYNEALVQTEKKQFLLNLIRLRYRDRPKILGITTINSQFSFFAESPGIPQLKTLNDWFHASTSDAPTITFSPLGGPDFTLGLLKPIPLEQMLLLANTGWDLDRVMRLMVHTMNGLENVPRVGGQGEERVPQFAEFTFAARQLGELHQRGLLEIATEYVPTQVAPTLPEEQVRGGDVVQAVKRENKDGKDHFQFRESGEKGKLMLTESKPVHLMRIAPGTWNVPEVAEMGHVLKLAPGLPAYRLVQADEGQFKSFGMAGRADLLLSMRSVLGLTAYLSKGIEIPPPHFACGLVSAPVDEHGQPFDWTQVTDGLFHVRVQKKMPVHAFVAVKYLGWWFYIANDDLPSKSTMQMVMELYDLQTVQRQAGPVLTLPINASRGGQ